MEFIKVKIYCVSYIKKLFLKFTKIINFYKLHKILIINNINSNNVKIKITNKNC